MGRSQLQGMPWQCACRASINHNSPCVGKLDCEEFERRSGRVQTINNKIKKQRNKNKTASSNFPTKLQIKDQGKNAKKTKCVEIGSIVTIKSQDTSEVIELGKITSRDNPFYSKVINSVVNVKGIPYKVIKIL